MKKYNNLYDNIYKLENIIYCFNEICKNTRNKKRVAEFKSLKCVYISRVYNDLKNKTYEPGKFNVFYIYDPKKRRIVSQNMYDKLVNHLVSRYILYPSILPCLINENCASRPNKGVKYALDLYYKYRRILYNNYNSYYILKCDIKDYFGSINIDILKEKIERRIKDKDSLLIINKILDSDNKLSIGFMTSQILGIFYLNDLDHYIKENLHIKYYVRYQDDFLLMHQDKEYLKYCLNKIKEFLIKDDLILNKKTRIHKNTDNFIFLGRNKYNNYTKYRNIKRKIKYKKYLYENNIINLNSYISSINSYKNLINRKEFKK
ncbi:MAG: RNA-directed DNA polymerase [Bacilli bacterium]|nr:RNA-directed DNA polymerase [Bacilli bacterium]